MLRKTVFIPNGVNRPKIQEAELITEKYGLEKDSYILFLGRLVPEKGIRYLVEAFKNVKTDKKLVIAGGSSDTDSFMNELKDLAISMHDSWISFVCLAVNGFFYSDQNAYIMYRQHDANVLGAQRHSMKDTLRGIIKNKNVLRSDMAKEILKGYSEMMPEKTKEDFIFFAEYKDNLKYKLKILMLPYNKKKTTKRTFEKVKLRIVFNTI